MQSSSETQGQLVGAGKSQNGREKNSGEVKSRTQLRALICVLDFTSPEDVVQWVLQWFCPLSHNYDQDGTFPGCCMPSSLACRKGTFFAYFCTSLAFASICLKYYACSAGYVLPGLRSQLVLVTYQDQRPREYTFFLPWTTWPENNWLWWHIEN